MCIVIYMKGSKRDLTYVQRKNAGKKSGEKAGSAKLDRKSSRGMIYENEELRLRTININAEVERGQSDIRKLRRENEQLRREIWSLRDEYDRLNKRFKANKYLPDSISEHGQSESNSEDSDSCDTCRGEADINEECLDEQHDSSRQQRDNLPSLPNRQQYDRCPLEGSICRGESFSEQSGSATATETNDNSTPAKSRDHLHVNFDHLSIVSEENLSNSDGNLTQPNEGNHQSQKQQQHLSHQNYYYDENFIEIDSSRLSPTQCIGAMSLPSLVGPLTPMTPIELVANQLNDLQSNVPPLSYFENVVQQHMGTTITSMADSNASTNTGETVIQTNGWDYNIQSPFVNRKFQSSEPFSSNSTSTTMSPSHLNNPVPAREDTPQLDISTNASANVCNPDGAYKNLKHFFSPIKPRLKLDTALAAKVAASGPAVQYLEQLHQNCEPPDVYITNALASPYYPQPIVGLSLPSVLVPPVQQSYIEPIYATAQKKSQCSEQSLTTSGGSKNSVNLEQILNEIGTISEDILQMQLEKSKSQEKLITESHFLTTTTSTSATTTPLHTATTHTQTLSSTSSPTNFPKEQHHQNMPSDKNRKPYRSEMNLLLSYNGSNPVIIPLAKNSTGGGTSTSEAAQVLVVDEGVADRDGNSPSPPQLPTPMAPFPTTLMYLGFDRLNQPLGDSGEVLFSGAKAGLQYIPSPSLEATHQHMTSPSPPLSSAPPVSDSGRSKDANVFRICDQDALNPALAISSPDLSTSPLIGANLSAVAPLKRRVFSRQNEDGCSSQITRSFDGGDVNTLKNDTTQQPGLSLPEAVKGKLLLEGSANELSSYESSSGSEAAKRKSSRRVSIVCREENSDTNEGQPPFDQQPSSTSVEDKLDDMLPSLVANLKHAHSTPNSPHSNRRRGCNTNSAISVNSGSTTLHHHGHHHHHHHHHHNRKLSQESINEARGTSLANSIVNSSQDNVLGVATITSSHQHTTRYKCSRRHSEGTVSSMVGDRGGGGSGVAGAGIRLSSTANHHHHHHHQDSNQETGTSISERNSGSLASSRESSTSLSMRSQRRKISVSSHTGGKIPWCGCWGNGCL